MTQLMRRLEVSDQLHVLQRPGLLEDLHPVLDGFAVLLLDGGAVGRRASGLVLSCHGDLGCGVGDGAILGAWRLETRRVTQAPSPSVCLEEGAARNLPLARTQPTAAMPAASAEAAGGHAEPPAATANHKA